MRVRAIFKRTYRICSARGKTITKPKVHAVEEELARVVGTHPSRLSSYPIVVVDRDGVLVKGVQPKAALRVVAKALVIVVRRANALLCKGFVSAAEACDKDHLQAGRGVL